MKKNNLLGSKITFVLGVLILISSVKTTGETTAGFVIGNIMMFSSLAYMARRKQINQPSTKWLIVEIISIIIILYFTILGGIIGGGWYNHPLPFMITPICFAIAYIVAFRSGKKTNKTPNIEIKQENKEEGLSILEKLSDLKKKGVITEEDFNKKKKQILELK